MTKNILSLAALLIASATFVACSNDDNIIDKQPVQPTEQVYTMTIEATKGDASRDQSRACPSFGEAQPALDEVKGDGATTRALSLDDKTLNATWATTENVYVQKGSTWATGSLQPQADGATATLKGTLSGVTIAASDVLTLQFPRSGALDYTGQVGTLADIAEKYDYATASVTVSGVSATGNIIPTEATTTFENQQAIVKFTLIDKADGTTHISATELVVSDGTTDYTVTPASATDVLYVAIPGFSGQTVTLTATDGSDTYTYEKSGVTFQNGKYYTVGVKMQEMAATKDLSTLTGDYTAKDGEVLTGTLSGNHKVSIAASATVMLKDVTINGVHVDDDTYKWAGITCAGSATIILAGTNTVKGFCRYYPGLYVPTNKTLTIKGSGSLDASSNGRAAGIGGGDTNDNKGIDCGSIRIEGGTITATGGNGSPGIGSGSWATCGDITITGGTVTATGGLRAAGIGSGRKGKFASITIGEGITSVTATAGYNSYNFSEQRDPIGTGYQDTGSGSVTIDGTTTWTAGTATEHLNWAVSTVKMSYPNTSYTDKDVTRWTLTHK